MDSLDLQQWRQRIIFSETQGSLHSRQKKYQMPIIFSPRDQAVKFLSNGNPTLSIQSKQSHPQKVTTKDCKKFCLKIIELKDYLLLQEQKIIKCIILSSKVGLFAILARDRRKVSSFGNKLARESSQQQVVIQKRSHWGLFSIQLNMSHLQPTQIAIFWSFHYLLKQKRQKDKKKERIIVLNSNLNKII
ncbi:hypothetical protein ABPG72_014925 [Tetrahymena utriculariae]